MNSHIYDLLKEINKINEQTNPQKPKKSKKSKKPKEQKPFPFEKEVSITYHWSAILIGNKKRGNKIRYDDKIHCDHILHLDICDIIVEATAEELLLMFPNLEQINYETTCNVSKLFEPESAKYLFGGKIKLVEFQKE